jgi:glycosyltransferase involved in cell wall biosynthesis
MIERYVSWGLDPAKITHVTNGQPDYTHGRIAFNTREKRNRFGFFGQLVDNKGVWVLLRAVQQLRAEGFKDFVIEINGDNLQYASAARRAEFEAFLVKEDELPVGDRIVVFNGSYSVDQL